MPTRPEDLAREEIDRDLAAAGWVVQDVDDLNLHAGRGVAVREFQLTTGPVDSTAAGTARPDSDVDLFVVGDELDSHALHRALSEAGLLMGREVNPVKYTKAALASRLASGARFVREALAGPKSWVAGRPTAIEPIAIAAGYPFSPPTHIESIA